MKTRVVEVPVCDKCSRDGEVLMVMSADGEAFPICRCSTHTERLRAEGEATGHEAPARRDVVGREAADRLVMVIKDSPGLRPGDYARQLGFTPQRVGLMARQLAAKGVITVENRRYTPV